jgi:hypothetical protein
VETNFGNKIDPLIEIITIGIEGILNLDRLITIILPPCGSVKPCFVLCWTIEHKKPTLGLRCRGKQP